MVEIVIKPLDVSFHKPFDPGPSVVDLVQGGVTRSLGAESMRPIREDRFIDALQQAPYHFLDELVVPCGYSEGTVTAITFGTVGPADGLGSVPVCCEEFNQVEHPLVRESVQGVAIYPWSGGPGIGVDFLIRLHPQRRCLH